MKNKSYFSAIDRYVVDNIPKPVERPIRGGLMVSWGEDNQYPKYLASLYQSVTTLATVIDGTVDYIVGDGVTCLLPRYERAVNSDGESVEELVRKASTSMLIYGGFAVEVIPDRLGRIAELRVLDFDRLRSDEGNSEFYYAKDWSGWTKKYSVFPAYDRNEEPRHSIYYVKRQGTRTTYPAPIYHAAVVSCEIQKKIDEYHLNALANGFTGSYIIALNNGVPNEEQEAEIERRVNEKFGGVENTGRIMVTFADDKEHGVELHKLDTTDFGERYNATAETAESRIFTAFRATPNLFGLPTKTTGFNAQEYAQAFKLYDKTIVRPLQQQICGAFDYIFGVDGAVIAQPFTIDFGA